MGSIKWRPMLRRAGHVFSRGKKNDDARSSSVDTGSAGAAEAASEKKDPNVTDFVHPTNENGEELPEPDTQQGVSDAEALTLTWTKKTLLLVFIK